MEGAGHYGIFSGRRWRDMVYPVVRQFIAEHQKGHTTSKTKAAVEATYTHEHPLPEGLKPARKASTKSSPQAAAKAPVAKAGTRGVTTAKAQPAATPTPAPKRARKAG